jgi:hypothetical protein
MTLQTEKLIRWAVLTVLSAATLAVALPNIIGSKTILASNACVNNLMQLDKAKKQWAIENGRTMNDAPTIEDLRPYAGRMWSCPQGGTYLPGKVGQPPRCSIGGEGHRLPD